MAPAAVGGPGLLPGGEVEGVEAGGGVARVLQGVPVHRVTLLRLVTGMG